LRVVQGPSVGQRYLLGEKLLVGSAPGAGQLVLADPSLYPAQLELVRYQGRLFARSVAPPNTTFHNDAPLGAEFALCGTGDRFRLGASVTLTIEEDA
jgi:hypothetical protein